MGCIYSINFPKVSTPFFANFVIYAYYYTIMKSFIIALEAGVDLLSYQKDSRNVNVK